MSMRLLKMLAPFPRKVEFYGFDDGCFACIMTTSVDRRLGLLCLSKVFIAFDDWPEIEWYLGDFNKAELHFISKQTWSKQEWLDRGFTYAKILC